MALIRINRDPPPKQLAIFAGLWLIFLGGWGLVRWSFAGADSLAMTLWIAAVAVPVAGAVHRPILRWTYVGMSYAAFPIGWVVSHVLLAIIYYLVMTPIGLIMRVVGYDPMERKWDSQAESYWAKRSDDDDPKRYFRQF